MYPKYITGSLRESCKILVKGFNKKFLPGSLTEHPVHHLEIFLGCSGLLEIQSETYVMSTVITLNTYLQGVPSHHQCRGYVHIYMYVCVCVQDSETDSCGTVSGGNIHNIIILMEVKTQEQVLKLFSMCSHYFYSKK